MNETIRGTAILVFIAVIFAAIYIGNSLQEPARVQKEIFKIEEQNKRIDEQETILKELANIGDITVNEFVADWRKYFPTPSLEEINELKIIQLNIKTNVKDAENFTVRKHAEDIKERNAAFSPVFGLTESEDEARPGLR